MKKINKHRPSPESPESPETGFRTRSPESPEIFLSFRTFRMDAGTSPELDAESELIRRRILDALHELNEASKISPILASKTRQL